MISCLCRRLSAVLALSLAVCSPSADAYAEVLYATRSCASCTGLIKLDANTFQSVHDYPSHETPIAGLTYDASTDTLFGYRTYYGLYRVDRGTGALDYIGGSTSGTGFGINTIAIRPGTFDMFGLSHDGDLYKINKQTGVPTFIGGDTTEILGLHAMAFSPSGELWASDNYFYSFISVDPATGQSERVPFAAQAFFRGLAFNAAGEMYGADFTGGRLVRIDMAAGTLTEVSSRNMNEIAFVTSEGMPGDYNHNNVIDAADYSVWRDAMASGSSLLPNDPTPGAVDQSDFQYWRNHFGETLGSGAGSAAAALPEPTTLVLAVFALLCGHLFRRRAHC